METENPFKGASSYEDGDPFYGRENEVKELTSLVRNESLTLLFSRSGTGKSSLLKAGLFPALKSQSEFFPVYIHLNDAAVKQTSDSNLCDYVIKICTREIDNYFKDKENYTITLPGNIRQDSLFEFIHNIKIVEVEAITSSEYVIKPILIFDQLEEIFTSPFNKSELQFLAKEIKCLIDNEIPDYLKNEIAGTESNEYQKLKNTLKSKQKNFRIVFSFREEYLPQFESLRKEIPAIRFTNARYRLEPFTIDTAKNIITRTAPLIKDEIATIVAENIAIEIEGFDEKRVDPFLLSLICQIIYPDLLQQNNTSSEDAKLKIKSLVENAIESYVTKVYKTINEETKKFIEKKLITSDGNKNSVNYNEVKNNSRLQSDIEKLVGDPNYRLLSIGQFLDSSHVSILHDRLLPPLIKRKEERKSKEDYDAFIVTQKEWTLQNRKRQRILSAIFLGGTAIFLAFYLMTYYYKKGANQLKASAIVLSDSANRASARAIMLTKRGDSLLYVADSVKNLSDSIRTIASKEKDSANNAIQLAKRAQKNYETLRNLTDALQKFKDTVTVQADLQKNEISPFTLNKPLYEAIYDSLFNLKNRGLNVEYQELLKAIIVAVTARRQILSDTIKGYFDAKEVWRKNKNPIVEDIIFNFINRPIYYKQIISLPNDDNSFFNSNNIILSFSDIQNKNKLQDFTYSYNNRLYVGNYNPDSDSIIIKQISSSFINSSDFSDTTSLLNSLAYTHDTVAGLINDSFFTFIPGEKKINMDKTQLPISKNSMAIISPNGQFVITYKNFDSVILWSNHNINESKKVILKPQPDGIKSIMFSRRSDQVVILGLYGDLTIYKLDSQTGNATPIINSINAKYNFDRSIQAVNFTDDGNELIASGRYYTYIRNLDTPDTLHPLSKNPYYGIIESVCLSPDFRKLLFSTPTGIFVVKDKNEDFLNKTSGSNLIYRKLCSKEKIKIASFLSPNSVIGISDSGDVYLLKMYPQFRNLDVAFKTIQQAPLPLVEQLKLDPTDSIAYNQVLNSNDWRSIRNAADFYHYYNYYENLKFSKPNLVKSRELYQKLLTKGSNNQYKQQDARTLINISKELSDQDTSKPNKAMYYKQIINIAENYSNSQDINTLSIDYGNLSFYSFFARNFEEGLKYAEKGIELDSTNNFIITNLTIGYLFTNKFEKAEYYYTQYKDQFIKGSGQSFKEGFKQDLRDLEAYGIINKKDELMYNEVEHIRNDILK
ncbi:MAG: hypothetical protein ABJB05_02980 [Parafilimonas sp.]